MTPITRRRFVQQATLSAGALYAFPFQFATAAKTFQQAAARPEPIDAAAIRKLASTNPRACDYACRF
jgi:hypothetical protein